MNNGKINIIFIAIILLLAGTVGILLSLRTTPPPASCPAANCSAVTTSSESSYASNEWKVWTDGIYDKTSGTYRGYTLRYPRDFETRTSLDGGISGGSFIGTPRVQIRFPADAFAAEKTNFGEAWMTVSVGTSAKDIAGCFNDPNQNSQNYGKPLTAAKDFAGISWYMGSSTDVGAGQIYTSVFYRAKVQNLCYEISETVHTGNIGNYPSGTVTEFDTAQALGIFDQMAGALSFTDKNPF